MHAEWLMAVVVCCVAQNKPAAAPAPAEAGAVENVEIRYARAQVQLAEANLQRVRQMNRRLQRTVPDSIVAEYQRDLEIAQLQLQRAASGPGEDEFQVWLHRAEMQWKTAEEAWKKGTAVNQRAAGTIEPLDLERYRLRSEVARLQFQRGQTLAKATREKQLQWEVDFLNDELERAREETTRVSPFIRYFPIWR